MNTAIEQMLKNYQIENIYDSSKDNVKDIMNKSLFNHINRNIKSKKVLEEILFS